MASEGGALSTLPGVTTLGTGSHCSVSSGFGLGLSPCDGAGCWARSGTATNTSEDTASIQGCRERMPCILHRAPLTQFPPFQAGSHVCRFSRRGQNSGRSGRIEDGGEMVKVKGWTVGRKLFVGA